MMNPPPGATSALVSGVHGLPAAGQRQNSVGVVTGEGWAGSTLTGGWGAPKWLYVKSCVVWPPSTTSLRAQNKMAAVNWSAWINEAVCAAPSGGLPVIINGTWSAAAQTDGHVICQLSLPNFTPPCTRSIFNLNAPSSLTAAFSSVFHHKPAFSYLEQTLAPGWNWLICCNNKPISTHRRSGSISNLTSQSSCCS